uniref:Uncharacterized protein n=1 Tax=Pseudomonas aeruginosa TaxID=287 RepID=A0A2L1KGR9_PSEAI|nr:Hypothetical protein [Pseudomonas aeruginosa]AVE22025.1 Hypothetical protein [Pseudomonas aeruginosa]
MNLAAGLIWLQIVVAVTERGGQLSWGEGGRSRAFQYRDEVVKRA